MPGDIDTTEQKPMKSPGGANHEPFDIKYETDVRSAYLETPGVHRATPVPFRINIDGREHEFRAPASFA